MSFTDEYLALQKKKKKKDTEKQTTKTTTKSTGHSFTDEYLAQRSTAKEEDIAPLFVNKTASLYSDPEKFIAPVTRITPTAKKEEDERKWFQKGEFEDGYQLGDITKTILGTKTEISENLLAGVLGMGEKAVDAGAYIVGGVGGLLGADKFQEKTKKFIQKDLYNEENIAKKIIGVSASSMLNDMIGVDSEGSSVLGEKSDALVQSAGQLAGTLGLQAVGVPWFVTSGVVGFGSEAENALNQGASYGRAGMSAAISAGAEILTEKLFGGSGLGETGLIAVDRLTKGITNKAVKALADYGIDILAEGSEEVISEFMSNLGSSLYKEKKLGEILFSEEAIDGYIESFIGGGVLGGVMNASNAVSSVKSGRDYRSGLSVNEQKVVEKEVENRIAEQERGGKKLTDKEKAALEEAVIRDMEKGYISTDTIEEVLGGESYKAYKDTVDSEDALLKEYEELGNKQNASLAEQTRYNELHQQVQDLKQNSKRDLYKSNLSENVFRTVQNDRLTESYNEKARRGQAFEADLTKYDTKQQETIKKAVESGILNNTNRTHEFVDMIAKITADKGVLFDFTNNERLKESGFAVDDKQVNGYVTKDGVTLNIDSAKSLNSVVGHEITHVLEGTELYTALQSAVTEYAKTKGDYQGRYDSLSKLYEGVDGADVDAELTADLVGDYLFTDEDFVRNLSVQHRNVFQKIYDEIKYLCKVATAGSKEARELEKVKRAFEKAYQEGGKQQEDDGDTKYSLVEDQETIDFLENQDYIVTYKAMQVIDGKLYPPMSAETKVQEEYTDKKGNKKTKTVRKLKQPSELGRWQKSDENPALAEQRYDPKKGYSSFDLLKGNGKTIQAAYNPYEHTSNIVLNDQFEEAYNRPNLVTVEYHIPVSELTSGYKAEYAKDAVGQHSWKSGPVAKDLKDPRQVYLTRWSKPVRILPDSEVAAKYKEILDGTGLSVPFNVVTPSLLSELEKAGVSIDYEGSPMYKAIQKRAAEKKAKYSLSDSDGKQLTKEQQEYFKDSKVRDEKGNLKVMYHGSQDAGFHVFDASMSDDNTSFFFVDSNDVAASYSGTTETYEAKSFNTAEDANKFFAEIGRTEYRVVEKDGEYTLYDDGGEVATSESLAEIYEEFCDYEGVGYGNANYKVYLNLKNPLVVDVEGRNWDNVSREFSQEGYDRYQSLTTEEKDALTDLAGWEDFGTFRHEINQAMELVDMGREGGNLASAYEKLSAGDTVQVNMYDLFSIASDGFSEEALREFAVKQFNTRDYAKRAKEQGYDGVIFNNIVDVGGYGNGSEGAATVAIAFDSNQIKSVANEKPTADADIRYSLSDSEQSDNDFKVMDGGAVTKYSLSTWTSETQEKVRANLVKAGYEKDRVDKWIKDTNSVASMIAADKDRLDFVAADNQVMLKDNQEYIKTLDASTLCAKRLVYQGTFDAIQHRMPNTMLSSDDLIDLLNMMKEHNVQTPCGVCYVESRRRHLGKFAQEWLNGYNGEYKPNLDEVTTSDGLEALRKSHPDTYEDFITAMNKKGSSNPKVVQLRTEYRNEIMSLTPAQIRKIEAIGGLRVQSFSDFETPHMLDMMQAVMDMSAKGLHSQAYTKVPNFAWVFGDTGIKINLSLIAEGDGFDSDGNLAFSSVEGMDIEDAMKLRDAYSKNVGTIIVGANDKHILACMADDRIDFIIPFHRSGWGMKELDMMGMSSYTDYTYGQKEHDLATGKGVANLYPPDYWDYNLSGKENAERYLNLCAKTGREPKFSKFLVNNGDGSYSLQPDGSTDGYWKTLIDFKMYDNDGNGAAQQKVQPNFNMEEAYRVLNEYEGGANKLPVANDVVEEFVAKYQNKKSLSRADEEFAPIGKYNVYGKDMKLETAPVPNTDSNTQPVSNTDSNTVNALESDMFPDDFAPMADDPERFDSLTDADAPARAQNYSEYQTIQTPEERRKAKLTAVQTELANNRTLRAESLSEYNEDIARLQAEYDAKKKKDTKVAQNILRRIERMKRLRDSTDADYAKRISDLETREKLVREGKPTTRQELHNGIVGEIKEEFSKRGYDFDEVLKGAKNLSTFSTVDNTPQRVMEKALGYKAGQALSDLTVNKVAQNETEGIKWLNSYTDRKSGLLRKISDQYHIKPGSKESAAAQMYAEGFYVAENNDIIEYGDAELAKDFPDARVQANIKGLASDPRIRQIYDDTLALINDSRTRNAYPEIQKLDNYFLHFRAMDDTFSKLGLPFNPNDIRAKDLPTDLNGVTADLKPGQPYFASAMHRTGKRTSFDLLGGLERYLTSAKNQIYHIDDIQTLRALRNHIADTYGQANGLESLDTLSEEEAQERIEKVYNSHLSTFAKFLNEEANILAGKTALIDRGLEGIIGRRGITFLNTVNRQVGSNMVGYNISSSMTNFLPVAQTFAKTNKFDFVKAFAQTVANKTGSIFGKSDGFAENSPVMIRRKGADRFYRTAWQKVGDPGYALMGAVDDISTELIARTKYNELVRKGMDSQTAHYETDKWVSRLMGDRSLGQMPQIYNSKMLGLVTKFQLEVRNQVDSQFYDTIQETKVSNEHIENALARNAKTAAKVTSTFVQLAVVQHLFGKAFESVAGYNPAFDIIEVLLTACGFDDEEDSEDTVLDNIEEGFLALLEDLPYASTFMDGGRIPISSALPIAELVKGEDEWGNEKSRWETLGEIAPYYVLPAGYGQIKKTKAGLDMFSDEHPIAGSYTDSGNLRFPVEDTLKNRVQAGIFGQWANENARDYFDNERKPLGEKQIQEFIDVDIPIRDYWEYREGLSGLSKIGEKADYIDSLDLPIDKKNLLINNIADRKEPIDMTGYDEYDSFEEFDFAVKNPEKYEIAEKVGGYNAYMGYKDAMKDMKLAEKAEYIAGLNLTSAQKNALINGETDRKEPIDMTGYDTSKYGSFEEFEYASENPGKYGVAKAVGGYKAYTGYSKALGEIKGVDNDGDGRSDTGTRKAKVLDYINGLDLDYGQRIILYRSQYSSKADKQAYNQDIVDYLNSRDDISYEEMEAILKDLDFTVSANGDISW